MTDVKARQMSLDEWRELLEAYGWADITVHSPLMPLGGLPPFVEYDIRMMLKAATPLGDRDEWVLRSDLLDQARRAVKAVQAKGYILMTAPRIEFGGDYKYRVDQGAIPDWIAEGTLEFSVHAT